MGRTVAHTDHWRIVTFDSWTHEDNRQSRTILKNQNVFFTTPNWKQFIMWDIHNLRKLYINMIVKFKEKILDVEYNSDIWSCCHDRHSRTKSFRSHNEFSYEFSMSAKTSHLSVSYLCRRTGNHVREIIWGRANSFTHRNQWEIMAIRTHMRTRENHFFKKKYENSYGNH